MKLIAVLLSFIVVLPAMAEEKKHWKGEGDFGYYMASGNTEATSLRAALKLAYETGDWTHTGNLDAINASDDDERTAESYTAKFQTNYSLTETYYVFGNGRYEDNRFSSYEYQASVASGLGVKLIETERTLLSLEGGVGYRRSQLVETGETTNEAIVLGAMTYNYRITDTTQFESGWRVEAGEENTYIEAILGLKVRINSSLALKLGYNVKHNTEVTDDVEHTDTITTVSLNYSF